MLHPRCIKGLPLLPWLDILCYIEFMVIIVILLAGAATMFIRCDRAVCPGLSFYLPICATLYCSVHRKERNIWAVWRVSCNLHPSVFLYLLSSEHAVFGFWIGTRMLCDETATGTTTSSAAFPKALLTSGYPLSLNQWNNRLDSECYWPSSGSLV